MHPIVTRTARIAVAVAAISAIATTPALAAGTADTAGKAKTSPASVRTAGCPSSGFVSWNERCTSLSSGALYVQESGKYLSAWYVKVSGDPISAQLGVAYIAIQWSGFFGQSSGTTKNFTYLQSDFGNCGSVRGYLEVRGQGTFTTPSTLGC